MYGINYDGLKKKETYNELIDYVLNKQEKIKYPNRSAKIMRNSPQLSNLLDGNGEGLLEMEEQQKRQVQEVEKEHTIRDMAGGGPGNSAAEIRATTRMRKFSTQTPKPPKTEVRGNQTMNPKMVSTESQAWRPNIASIGTQPSQPYTASTGSQPSQPYTTSGGSQTDKPGLVRGKQKGASYPDVFDMSVDDDFQDDLEKAIEKSKEE